MDFGHHAGYPAHIVVFAAGAGFPGEQLGNVLLHGRLPMALVGHIDGKFARGLRDLRVELGLDKLAAGIQRKYDHTVAQAEHKLGLRPVERIAAGYLGAAVLQEGLGGERACGFFQDGENSADRNIDVDIGRAV